MNGQMKIMKMEALINNEVC